MFVVQNRETKHYLGHCSTVGDVIWLDNINNHMVDKYDTIQSLKGDLNWVPWYWWWMRYKIIKI